MISIAHFVRAVSQQHDGFL